jgi:hypothetical protein
MKFIKANESNWTERHLKQSYICKEHDVIKTSSSTFENFLSTKAQKMMLHDNANNLLKKCEEYFKAPIPVAKLSYTSCTGKQPINGNVVKELHENSLGGVNDDEHKGGFRAGGFRVEIYIPKVALFAEVQSRPLPKL